MVEHKRYNSDLVFPRCSVQGNGETFDLIPANLAQRKETIKIVIKPSSKSSESLTLKIHGNVANFFHLCRNIFFNFCDMIQEDVCISYMWGAGTFSTLELGLGFLSTKMLFILLFTNAGPKF